MNAFEIRHRGFVVVIVGDDVRGYAGDIFLPGGGSAFGAGIIDLSTHYISPSPVGIEIAAISAIDAFVGN